MEKKKIILVVVLFVFGLVVAFYVENKETLFQEEYQLERNEAGEGNKKITLILDGQGILEGYPYEFALEERYLTEHEAIEKMKLAVLEIEEDFLKIERKLPIKKMYQNGLVEAKWSFDKPEYIDAEGNILQEAIPKEGLLVNATVTLSCQKYELFHMFSFRIEKQLQTEQEHLLESINQYINEQMQIEGVNQLSLPEEINGIPLQWKEQKDYLVLKIALLEVIVVVLLVFSKIEKKKQQEKERVMALELDYPEITSQLSILVGAGMSISQGLFRIVEQYQEQRKRGLVARKDGFEELVYICCRIQEGESEREAFTRLGSRVNNQSYHRLIRILLTHKDKGMGDLRHALEEEAQDAYGKRVQLIKKKGEEASTKMLVPLMLMMILVMVIVMLPAIMEFSA